MIKPMMARGELRLVGATTLDEYRQHIEKDPALERRFQKVLVEEPSVEDTIGILRGLKERLELHHGVRITDGALVAAATLSDRYITDRFLPDKAIDLVDEASSRRRIELDSRPAEIDSLERLVRRLEIEEVALGREKDPASQDRLAVLHAELSVHRRQLDALTAAWEEDRRALETVRLLTERLDQLRREAETCEREGALGRAAEVRYDAIPQVERELAKWTLSTREGPGAAREEVPLTHRRRRDRSHRNPRRTDGGDVASHRVGPQPRVPGGATACLCIRDACFRLTGSRTFFSGRTGWW
jgi:ATP-dependent Clp protease ATP-binding subunit ClpB